MECKRCDAYGIDNLGFRGCLIKNSMLDFPSGKVGCYKRKTTILKHIEKVIREEPRAEYYKWKRNFRFIQWRREKYNYEKY